MKKLVAARKCSAMSSGTLAIHAIQYLGLHVA